MEFYRCRKHQELLLRRNRVLQVKQRWADARGSLAKLPVPSVTGRAWCVAEATKTRFTSFPPPQWGLE